MRTIKYRAWHKRNKEFYNWGIGNIDDNGGLGTFPSDLTYLEHNQYTGLLDKNGKEVYEGDIIVSKTQHKDCGQYEKEPKNKIVTYYTNGFEGMFISLDDDYSIEEFGYKLSYSNILDYSDIKVIGNIYENSDLLNRHTH